MSTHFVAPAVELEVANTVTSKLRFHPGWVVLGVAALGIFMSGPGQSYSVAAFIEQMLTDLKLSRTAYSSAYCVATLLGGLTLPLVGRLVDRYGARIMLPVVALLLGLACLWMASIRHLAALYVGFTMIRCLGQGALTLISTWLVGEWFQQRRGLAMGIMGLGGTMSVMAFPQVNHLLIAHFDWRTVWVVFAVGVWVVLVLPGLVLIRNRPEDLGLLPDGRRAGDKNPPDQSNSGPIDRTVAVDNHQLAGWRVEDSWTVAEACRSSTFWKIIAVMSTSSMIGTGLVFHQVSLLGARGVSEMYALALLGLHAVVATFSSLVAGYLTDRIQSRYLLLASMVFFSSALFLLVLMPTPALAVLYSSLLGLHGGIMRSTGSAIWVNYFGRLHQGAIRGIVMSITIAAAALGPLPLALAKDQFGNYTLALSAFLLFPAVSAYFVWSARPPVKAKTNTSGISLAVDAA